MNENKASLLAEIDRDMADWRGCAIRTRGELNHDRDETLEFWRDLIYRAWENDAAEIVPPPLADMLIHVGLLQWASWLIEADLDPGAVKRCEDDPDPGTDPK